jgi:hypothetical protein
MRALRQFSILAMNARLAMAQSRAQGYEAERFVRLFGAAQSDVLRYILALVPDLDDVQEVFQETAVDPWKTLHQYDPDCPFVPCTCRFGYFRVKPITDAGRPALRSHRAERRHALQGARAAPAPPLRVRQSPAWA